MKKYNVAGPRYTSYPPADQIHRRDDVGRSLSAKIDGEQPDARATSRFISTSRFARRSAGFAAARRSSPLNHDKGGDYLDYLDREVAQMAPRLNPERKVGPAPFRRRLAHVFAAGRNPPAGRNHPPAFHVFAGHRSERGGGPAPADARAPGGVARDRLQPRLDGRAGFQPAGAGGRSPHPAAGDDAAGDGLDARTGLSARSTST